MLPRLLLMLSCCSGEQHPEPGKNPYNTMIMITDAGEINMVYRWVGGRVRGGWAGG